MSPPKWLEDALQRITSDRRLLSILALGFGLGLTALLLVLKHVTLTLDSLVPLTAVSLVPAITALIATYRPLAPVVADAFWMERLTELYRAHPTGNAAAAQELMGELNLRRSETSYAPEILDAIRHGSVWAVCGRKSDRIAAAFLEANVASRRAGHYVERVFLIPADAKERKSVNRAIDGHLRDDMVVCVSHNEPSDQQVRSDWKLPLGFGMTLIGPPDVDHAVARHTPTGVRMVLVHWGGVDDRGEHIGVVLKEPVWIAHFCGVFSRISATCAVANDVLAHIPKSDRPVRFRARYPRYAVGAFRVLRRSQRSD